MKQAGWIVALIVLLAAAMLVHLELGSMDEERQEWRAKQDSLLRGWDASRSELTALRAHTDSLKAYTDSVAMMYPPAPVVIRRALKTFEYAPLGMAVDTLSAE